VRPPSLGSTDAVLAMIETMVAPRASGGFARQHGTGWRSYRELRRAVSDQKPLSERTQESRGQAPFKAFYTNLRGTFGDLHLKIEDIVAEGDKVVDGCPSRARTPAPWSSA
jgi:SnoaL-like polyketide cyclase